MRITLGASQPARRTSGRGLLMGLLIGVLAAVLLHSILGNIESRQNLPPVTPGSKAAGQAAVEKARAERDDKWARSLAGEDVDALSGWRRRTAQREADYKTWRKQGAEGAAQRWEEMDKSTEAAWKKAGKPNPYGTPQHWADAKGARNTEWKHWSDPAAPRERR